MWRAAARPPVAARRSVRRAANIRAHDFLTYFHNFIQKTDLPAPYDYSDYSTGLLGLFLGTTADQPIKDSSLDGWYAAVDRRILTPLGMTNTFLEVPSAYADRRAKGYDLPIAVAEVGSGPPTGRHHEHRRKGRRGRLR